MMNKVQNIKRSVATIAAIVVVAGLIISFKSEEKKYSVTLTLNQWVVYERNSVRLDQMAGRDVSSVLLLATKDTLNVLHNIMYSQIQEQLKDTTK